jgi:hypothetical protein
VRIVVLQQQQAVDLVQLVGHVSKRFFELHNEGLLLRAKCLTVL